MGAKISCLDISLHSSFEYQLVQRTSYIMPYQKEYKFIRIRINHIHKSLIMLAIFVIETKAPYKTHKYTTRHGKHSFMRACDNVHALSISFSDIHLVYMNSSRSTIRVTNLCGLILLHPHTSYYTTRSHHFLTLRLP